MSPGISRSPPTPAMQLFSKQLSLSAGAYSVAQGERVAGPMRRGLKVGVMLDGRQSLWLDDRPAVTIGGPAVLVAANGGEHLQQRIGLATGSMRCALMQFEFDFLDREFGAALAKLLDMADADDTGVWVRPAGAAMRALALQMVECPIADPLRGLYMGGKALELAAMALDDVIGERPARSQNLSSRTREQVQAARDMLIQSAQNPPSLGELARQCGLNPTKLTSAFRAAFGVTVYGYLQEHRLQQARALIASGEATIAEAAFRVGYSPAHFSSLFRKRFGMPPSALR